MRKRVFKYKIIKVLVVFSSTLMLLLIGIGLYDLFDKYGYSDSIIENLTLITIAFIFLLKLLGLIFVIFKFSKSILLLNIFYILSSSILILSLIRNYAESFEIINLVIILTLLSLTFLVNKFKYKEVQYESIDLIGTHND